MVMFWTCDERNIHERTSMKLYTSMRISMFRRKSTLVASCITKTPTIRMAEFSDEICDRPKTQNLEGLPGIASAESPLFDLLA
jgi:hypothetical protein